MSQYQDDNIKLAERHLEKAKGREPHEAAYYYYRAAECYREAGDIRRACECERIWRRDR